ncbi:MAG: UDP-N-acetylglucosamine 4,6-dehydratase family protein [Candidatus Hadarchaeum sp.]|uniref:UDP-N-acetylglucosamine 4,6-dehydratase family protein n=1 Tax=Candidatus Hadarchaeum sp. TaxID=2883567 RepID=UPI003D0B46B5
MPGDFFKGKNVLITGGAGSIGSEIARKLLSYRVGVVRVLDIDEEAQFELSQELRSRSNVRFLIGDVRDKERIKRAMEDIDIVFHVAALKHVPSCEYNPFEAVKTNVLGTQNVIEAAIEEEVEKFITISTDKAVNPINVMGATKLLAEKLTISANYYKGPRKTAISCVRFGNVLGSSGSVVTVFAKQISRGESVTITEPNMTRFVMTIERAVELVLKATQLSAGGEIFIFKMPAVRIGDLAEVMIEELAPRYGHRPSEVRREIIGIRPGEKFHEELMTEEESVWAQETEDMFIVRPPVELPDVMLKKPGEILRKPLTEEYLSAKRMRLTSKDARLLNKHEIKKLLRECNILQ